MPKPYKCEVCGETDPSKFYKNRKGLCKIHFAEYVNLNKCEKEREKIDTQIDELDGLDAELAKRDKEIQHLWGKLDNYCKDFDDFYEEYEEIIDSKTVDLKKDIDVIFLNDKRFQKDVDFLTKKNNQLESQVKSLTEENEDFREKIDLLNTQMIQAFEYMNQLREFISENLENQDETKSVKSETSVRFDIPKEKPVLGSAQKKGFYTVEEITFTKNRLKHMKSKDLKILAGQLKIKTSKPNGGYKTNDDLKFEILKKLDSWIDTQ